MKLLFFPLLNISSNLWLISRHFMLKIYKNTTNNAQKNIHLIPVCHHNNHCHIKNNKQTVLQPVSDTSDVFCLIELFCYTFLRRIWYRLWSWYSWLDVPDLPSSGLRIVIKVKACNNDGHKPPQNFVELFRWIYWKFSNPEKIYVLSCFGHINGSVWLQISPGDQHDPIFVISIHFNS